MSYSLIGPIGFGELIPILLIVIVLFGAKKLPELARAMGSSINQFKKGLSEAEREQEQLTEGSPPREPVGSEKGEKKAP